MRKLFVLCIMWSTLATFVDTENPRKCSYKTNTTCGYYITHEEADFDRANQICRFYDDSVLAGATTVEKLSKNDKLKWTGFKYFAKESEWIWIGDGKPLQQKEVNKWFNQMEAKNISESEDNQCLAISGINSYVNWHILPCDYRLNESFCQRPIRTNCHRWNFTYGCLWEDEKCEHRYEEKFHNSDDQKYICANGKKYNLFRLPCEPNKCVNCKLSVWSQWSDCNYTQCNRPGFRLRKKRVLVEAVIGATCNKLNTEEKKSCSVPCPSSPSTTQEAKITTQEVKISREITTSKVLRVSSIPPTIQSTKSTSDSTSSKVRRTSSIPLITQRPKTTFESSTSSEVPRTSSPPVTQSKKTTSEVVTPEVLRKSSTPNVSLSERVTAEISSSEVVTSGTKDIIRGESSFLEMSPSSSSAITKPIPRVVPNVTTLEKRPGNFTFTKPGIDAPSLRDEKNIQSSTIGNIPGVMSSTVYVYIALSVVGLFLLVAISFVVFYYAKSNQRKSIKVTKPSETSSTQDDKSEYSLLSIAVPSKYQSYEVTRDVLVNLPIR